jgi:uncharacterized protein YdaU (DUF1376 family)
MAALPYMQLYVADYLADTQHLTTEEHGAYLLLLFSYWQTGKSLRSDRLAPVARLSNERWNDVKETLREFFFEDGNQWIHFRVEADLESVNSKSLKASGAGKASARARAARRQAVPHGISTNVEQPYERIVNHTDTDTDTDTDNKKPVAAKAARVKFDPLPMKPANVSEQVWAEWCQARSESRKPLTKAMCTAQAKQLDGHGNADEVIRKSIAAGWQGLFPDGVKSASPRHSGFAQTDYMDGLTVDENGSLRF